MNEIFSVYKILDVKLQDTLAILLSDYHQNQSVILYDYQRQLFKEYLILNFRVSKVICDPNMQILLLFEENKDNQGITLHIAKLEKSFTPLHTIMILSNKIQQIEWCNSSICAIALQNELILFNIYSQTILQRFESNFQQLFQFKMNQKMDSILCQYSLAYESLQMCQVIPLDDFSLATKFENCIACAEMIQDEEHLFMITTNNNSLKLIIASFDKEIKIKQTINQDDIQIMKFSTFISIKYRKEKNQLLIIDSTNQLHSYNLDQNYMMKATNTYTKVKQFTISSQDQQLIYMDENKSLFQEGVKVEDLNNLQQTKMDFSISSQLKKSAIQGILSYKNQIGSIQEIVQKYSSDFIKFTPKFTQLINLRPQFKNFPLVDFRVLIYPSQEIGSLTEYIPDMSNYIETQSVKQHLKQFEITLKGDNPLLCEGDAASGKTSVIQYLAYKNQQPLLIMNLNSYTQISDLIGKIEILPGFKLEFRYGPFASAVQKGMWILLDEANLASDSVLRVIEDVLELGYLTVFGNSINSHNDLIDGTLTIRKHQNFKLFLTQNPAADSNFSRSRHVFSPSLMSQFIQIYFKPMTENDLENILGQIFSRQRKNSFSFEVQQKLISLIMKIYLEIRQNDLDGGLFTLRDILQIVDAVSLEPNLKNIFDIDILPMNSCLKFIITQFLDINKKKNLIYQLIDQFNFLGYSNKNFEETKDRRIMQIMKWNQLQEELFLKFHILLFSMLTLCYRTKRPALVIGQQFCGKLTSVKIWLKLQEIQNYEVFELSESTTNEDLFGKYQPSENGFQFVEGPITRCFSQGKVLILLDIEAPESALTESLNGILEKKFLQLIVQNKKYERHKDFHIIALSSDKSKIQEKFTPALKSRFLSKVVKFKVTIQDVCQLFRQVNLPEDEQYVCNITKQLGLDATQQEQTISFQKIIRFLQPIKHYIQFVNKNLIQKLSKEEALTRVIDCIQFFLALSLEDNTLLYSNSIKLPLRFEDIIEGSFEEASKKFIFTPSRKRVADIISISIASKVPLLLQGSAGVGKTKIISMFSQTCTMFLQTQFYYINMNQNTDINDLMGQFVCSCKKEQKEFRFEKGLLFSAMEKGGIALVDEVNLSQFSILNFLASVAKYPTVFVDPVSNSIIKIHEKFRIFFAQNPPNYIGRIQLPEKLKSKVIVVEVPNYTFNEVLQICQGTIKSVQKGMEYFLTKIIPYPEDGDEKKLKFNNIQFTLRQFIKFRNRLEKTNFQITDTNWQDLIKLHQIILYPKELYEQNQLKSTISYSEKEQTITFQINNDNSELQFSLQASRNLSDTFKQEILNLSQQQRLLLSQIALCFFCKENALIEGETSFKTYITRFFSSIIQFKNPNPFELIYTSSVTEIADLIGNTESHNQQSYLMHCRLLMQKLSVDQELQNLDQIKTALLQQAILQDEDIFFNEIIQNLNNQFPFVERGLTFSARFGGVVCLKNIALADQSVLEGLNALLELEPHFVVNGKKIDIHNEFIVIALLNSNFGCQLSDALQSRLTKISIQPSELLNSQNQLQESYQRFIISKISIKEQQNQIKYFFEQLLSFLKKYKYEQYKCLSSRKFYKWINFLELNMKASNLEKLVLGFQFVILDQKRENFVKLIQDESFLSIFTKAQISIQQQLQILKLFNSSKIIMNPITNQIIQRIFSSFSVNFIPCLIGPPGIGKSAIAQEVANILGKEFQRVCCSDSLSVDDLFGSYAPKFDGGTASFTFQEGYLATALRKKSLILFDEVNLASPEVLSTLQALFNTDEKSLYVKDFKIDKTDCVFLCSMNPPSYQGRQFLPQCIQDLLCDVHLDQFTIEEILNIFQQSYNEQIKILKDSDIDFSVIIDLHKELSQLKDNNQSSNYDFNIRFLQNLLYLFSDQFIKQRNLLKDELLKKELIVLCLEIIYVEHYYQTSFAFSILKTILSKYEISLEQWNSRKVFLEQKANMLYINRLTNEDFKQILRFQLISLQPPQMMNNSYSINLQNSKIFEKMLIALQSQKIILCQGDTSTGKTSTIIALAGMLNQRFILLPINCDLETDDLLGNFAIVQDNYDELQQELQKLIQKQNVANITKNSQKSEINIKYIEGVLKICLKCGYWLILDNINLARPEIIERLNSLGEDSPCLYINEFGDNNRKITPHKQFRLICIQNPSRAESHKLSPAFYNRCLKINFKIDFVENAQDIVEILVKNGETCKLFQEENVKLTEKFLNQIIFLKNREKFNLNFRQVHKAYKMIQDNGINKYNKVMEIVFGQCFSKCSEDAQFPILDVNTCINPDLILNKLVSNSLKLFDSGTFNQILKLQNLYKFFEHYVGEKEFKKYQYFFNIISKKIDLKNSPSQNQFNTGSYELNLSGQIDYCLCGINIEIAPLVLSMTLRNKELQTLLMKIKCQFMNQQFQADAQLNKDKKFEIIFTKSNQNSISQMIEELIGQQYSQLFQFFQQMLEEAAFECQLLLDEIQEINFNFNLEEFSFSFLPMLKLKNIIGLFTLTMEKLVEFHFSFELYIFNVYLGKVKDLSQLKVEIELKPEKLIAIFKEYGCFYLLQNLELKQLQNDMSYIDLQERKIELNIGSQNPIQIFKLPFFVKFYKINAIIKLSDAIILKGGLYCTFQWYETNVCSLKAIIDNQNKEMFKLELDYEQPSQDLKGVLCQFFGQYFENNYFINKLVDMKELIIKKIDMITNAICWNFQIEIQLNLCFKIFGDITFEIKTIELFCHIDSNNCEFQILSTIEFFKFIMEIGVEINFSKLFSNQKSQSLKMIFRKAQNCPTFKEILSIYSPKIDGILEKIPGYKELKIRDKIKDLNIENPQDLMDINKFTKLGSSIVEEFKQQANERVEYADNQLRKEFEKELTKGKEKVNLLYEDGQKIVNRRIQKFKDTVNSNINQLNESLNSEQHKIVKNLYQVNDLYNQQQGGYAEKLNQGLEYVNDMKRQGEEEISRFQQTISYAKANLEKKINDQIEFQKDRVKQLGQDAFSSLNKLANSKESYLEFNGNSIEFKFDIPLLDEWKICRFLTLYDCNLQMKNEKELILDLKGKIKFFDIQFPEFSLIFSLTKPPIILFDNVPLEKGFDPIQYGLQLFDLKCEETKLFPTINTINIFQFNFETYEFKSEFSFKMENNSQKNSIISFSNILLKIGYKQQFDNKNLSQEVSVILETSTSFFNLDINLSLDFSALAKSYRANSNLKLILKSEPIQNFSFNEFVYNMLSFKIPCHIAEFKIQTINCELSIEKNTEWNYSFLLQIESGCCNFFENLISIKGLNGQLIYRTKQGWDGSHIKGECLVKNQNLGDFKFDFLKDKKKIQADLNPNKNFQLKKLISDLSGYEIKMSVFQEINFQNLSLMLEIQESHMLFKAIYKKDILKFDDFPFISLKNIDVEFQLVRNIDIQKKLTIDFQVEFFERSNLVIDGKITGFPLKVEKLVLPIEQTIFELFDILEEFNLYEIEKFQLFDNFSISVNLIVQLNQNNMKVEACEIKGTYKGQFEWHFLKITSLSLLYSRKNGKNSFKLEGNVILLDVYKLKFQYNTDQQTLEFLQETPNQNSYEMIQLTKSFFENQNTYFNNIQNFKVMTQRIPSFKKLLINFQNKSFLLELSYSKSQDYKIYVNWQSKSIIFYFGVKGKSFGDITSLFSKLDSILCFQQSDCLLIYSKQGDKPQDQILENNSNRFIQEYLENKTDKSRGLNFSTQLKFTFQPELQNFFSFFDDPKKEFNLKCSAHFENGFEFQSKIYEYKSDKFQGSLQFSLQSHDLKSIRFNTQLVLKYATQRWGELSFEGNVISMSQTSLKGDLCLDYRNVFGINDWDVQGRAIAVYENQQLNISVKIETTLFKSKIELQLNILKFQPVGLGFIIRNVSLKKILKFFNLEQRFPPEFLNYIPTIHKLGVILGEMPNDYNKSILPQKLQSILNSESIIGKVVSKILGVQKLEQKFFLIESSSESKQFIFDLALYQGAVSQQFYCKGYLKVDVSQRFLIDISLETQLSQGYFRFDGKGTIKILEENQINIKAYFKPNEFEIQTEIKVKNVDFLLELKAEFWDNISIFALLDYNLKKNKAQEKEQYRFFGKYFKLYKLVLKLEIQDQIQCKLEYSIEIADFKLFEGVYEITFDIQVIQNLKKLTFDKFAKFFSFLPGFHSEIDEKQFKSLLNQNAKKIQQFCNDHLNTDVSKELDNIKRQFIQEDSSQNDLNKTQEGSKTKHPQTPPKPQTKQNQQHSPPSSSPQPKQVPNAQQTSKPLQTKKNQNKLKSPSVSPFKKQSPKVSQSKQHQQPSPPKTSKLPQSKQNEQHLSASSSILPPPKTQLPQTRQPSPPKNQKPISPPPQTTKKQSTLPSHQSQNQKPISPPPQTTKKQSTLPSHQSQNQKPISPPPQLTKQQSTLPSHQSQNQKPISPPPQLTKQQSALPPHQQKNEKPNSPPHQSKKQTTSPHHQPKNPQNISPPHLSKNQKPSLMIPQPPPQSQENGKQQQDKHEKEKEENHVKKEEKKSDLQNVSQNQNQKENEKSYQVSPKDQSENEPIQLNEKIEKQESKKKRHNKQPSNDKNQEGSKKFEPDMINYLKNYNFDEDLKYSTIQLQEDHDEKKQLPQYIDLEPINLNYDMLLYSTEAEIASEWKNQQQRNIVPMTGRIIINDYSYSEIQLQHLGHLLLKLQFLRQKYDIILSGKCKPVFLKTQETPISINLIDQIFHELNGKCNNEELISVDLNNKQQKDFLIVFTEYKLNVSNQCKAELISDGVPTIHFFEQGKVYSLKVESGEINEVSKSFLEILGLISESKKKEVNSQIKQNKNTLALEKLNIYDISSINMKEANNLKSMLEISKYTKYSLSSKGTTIDIKGIIKFFCTNGTAKDIMKKKNKGGRSLYVFQVVLDLNNFSKACLIKIVIPFIYKLIEFCKECQIVCNLNIQSDPIIIVKQNFSTIWSQQEQEQLLNYIANFNDDIYNEYNCNQLRISSDHLNKFNQYRKYLILINHQLYNYSYQDLQIFMNLTQQQQIKLVSIGVEINKYTNRLMEGINHFSLIESDDLYKIMKDLLEKNIQQDLEIKKFEFKFDNERFPNELKLQQIQFDGQRKNLYLNKYFNYVSQTQISSDTQINKCSAIDINNDCSIVIAGCFNVIKIFEFNQEELKETQVLSEHEARVVTLNFMQQSRQFISGGKDNLIILWSINISNQWVCQQKLREHTDKIICLVLNNKENLIISGSKDETIRFWMKNSEWLSQQTIKDHTGSVLGLSMNQHQNKVISCGEDGQILIIEYQSSKSKWIILQRIVDASGDGICFIDNDIFAVQLSFGFVMEIYEKNKSNQLYEKTAQYMPDFDENLVVDQMLFGYQPFSELYIKSKGLLVNKIGNQLQFIRKNEQGKFQIEQSIYFSSYKFVGKMSQDGQHLVTWEKGTNNIYIRKYPKI